MNITVRELDTETYREFKSESVRRGMKVGEAMTQALSQWLASVRGEKKAKRGFLDFEATDWGFGTENSSKEIDEVLYGGNIH